MGKDLPDYSPTAVNVILRPGWAAQIGEDKDFYVTGMNVGSGASVSVAYNVPAGKTLVITDAYVRGQANLAADRDKYQNVGLYIRNETDALVLLDTGGSGGCYVQLVKPLIVEELKQVKFYGVNNSGHGTNMAVSAFGFEV